MQAACARRSSYGGVDAFCGPVATVKCHECNTLVRKALEGPGNGCVLVVDGGAALRCALVGDALAELAVKNGWRVSPGKRRMTPEFCARI